MTRCRFCCCRGNRRTELIFLVVPYHSIPSFRFIQRIRHFTFFTKKLCSYVLQRMSDAKNLENFENHEKLHKVSKATRTAKTAQKREKLHKFAKNRKNCTNSQKLRKIAKKSQNYENRKNFMRNSRKIAKTVIIEKKIAKKPFKWRTSKMFNLKLSKINTYLRLSLLTIAVPMVCTN